MYYLCGITEKGLPPHNEDALMLHHSVTAEGALRMAVRAPFLAAVCDGVSGEHAGELASQSCLEALSAVKYTRRTDLRRRILTIHAQIAEQSRRRADTANMQTTLCGIAVDETDGLQCFNVGDSRVYLCRGGRLEQLSRDQTLVQMLYEEGSITSEEKRVHSHKNLILPVMGNLTREPKPEIRRLDEGMQWGDLLLLCTDGLTDYVTPAEMESILAKPLPLPERLSEMVSLSLAKGGRDNITVAAVLRYPDDIDIPETLR